ncbi:MAG: lipoprotein signal peptidase [Candidatus Westeberhardia cardiocondylae]|nr:lipoprotein signal peptidase [Candidatus Westeberhardia cardiocondylae]
MKKKIYIYKKLFFHLTIIFLILLIDLTSKTWIINNIKPNNTIPITKNINLTNIYNTGIIFGILSDEEINQYTIISTISIIFLITIILIIIQQKKSKTCNIIQYTIIVGGSLGNILDRIIHKKVTDFIDLHINNWHFPNFNIADISIIIGVTLIIKNTIQKK